LTQKRAADTLGFDRAQVSRWENDVLRPTLDNLGQLLVGYNATLSDLVEVIGSVATEVDEGPTDEELLRSLAAAIRRVEGRQDEMAREMEQLKGEKELGRAEG
jgi:transcriptional regulator with XRE-family HTH domain